MTVCKGVMVSP